MLARRHVPRSCCWANTDAETLQKVVASSSFKSIVIARSTRPFRLAVRTRPFHGCNTGSIPVGVAITLQRDGDGDGDASSADEGLGLGGLKCQAFGIDLLRTVVNFRA